MQGWLDGCVKKGCVWMDALRRSGWVDALSSCGWMDA